MRVAIAGASGFLGSALARALRARGDDVFALVRPGKPRAQDTIRWDPAAGTIEAAGLEGLDAVVNFAGVSIGGGRGTAKRLAAIRDSRVKATDLLARVVAGLNRPPSVFIGQSAVGYYGDRGDEVLTEGAGPGPDFLATLVADWERACDPARAAGIRVANPRTGLVLHPSGGLLRQMLIPFRFGLGARLGSGRQWMSWVSLRDQVAAILSILDGTLEGAINVVAPNPVTNAEFTATLAGVLHRPAVLAVPQPVLDVALGKTLGPALTSSQRVASVGLNAAGFPFADPILEPVLRDQLRR